MNDTMIDILLIEDNTDDARLTSAYLSKAVNTRYKIDHCDMLSKGLEHLAEGDADVILLDLNLSDSMGLRTFEQVVAAMPDIPIIVLTGHADNELAAQAVRKGAQDYLVKGQFEAGQLHLSIRYAIERNKMILEMRKAEEIIRQYSRSLERMLFISREATIATDLTSLYQTFDSASKEILNLDFSTFMLLSEDKKMLTIQHCLGFPETLIGNFSPVEGQGLSTFVVKNKKPETVPDFFSETRFEVPALVMQRNIRSAIAVPMMMEDEVHGVLIGHTLNRREFTQQDINIYQLIANQAAVAVRNIHDVIHSRRTDGEYLLFEDCPIQKVISTGERYISRDEIFIRKDGNVFPVSMISAPLVEEGKIVASITAFRDISERKMIEQEREKLIADLQKALAEIKTLQGILPICSYCKKIRDDKGAWTQMEAYISERTDALFSHGVCHDCAKKMYSEYYEEHR